MRKFGWTFILCWNAALAANVSITMNNTRQVVLPGSFVMFSGTITNTGGSPLSVNGASVALPYFELDYDLTPFFSFAPLTLGAGASYSGPLFVVAVSGAAPQGDYFSSFSLQGGVDAITFDDLGSQGAQVSVVSPCDANEDRSTDIVDIQKVIDEALGSAAPATDLNGDGVINIVDVQLVTNAALGMGCNSSVQLNGYRSSAHQSDGTIRPR